MRVSISQIKLFKACRRAYELKYVERMFPIEEAEPLTTGKSFHSKIEELYKKGSFDKDADKQTAMAIAFEKYIYPNLKLVDAEKWFEEKFNEEDSLLGRVDGIADDGKIVEYKTTGTKNIDEYEYDLAWDEQILAYMYLTKTNHVHYVIIRKPTIRQKKNESDEEFFERMVEWYDEDTRNKIRLVDIVRSDEEIADFVESLCRITEEIKSTEECKHFYKNANNCWKWGNRCEYESICLHYDPNEKYIGFERRESSWKSQKSTNS